MLGKIRKVTSKGKKGNATKAIIKVGGPGTLGTGKKIGMNTGGNARAAVTPVAAPRSRSAKASDTKMSRLGMSRMRY